MTAKTDIVILDGGLGIVLLSKGAFQSKDPLWSSRCLASPPGSDARRMLKETHLDFVAAGADIIASNSYQMSVDHLQNCLPDLSKEECLDLMQESVRIARDACREYWESLGTERSGRKEPKVAGSIGPFGACLANMSEYTGAYLDSMTEEDLIEWHRPRLLALLEAGADYLAFETFPAVLEARAILRLLKDHAPDVPAWISFSCKGGGRLCHGEVFAEAAAEIWASKTPGLKAVGINCTHEEHIPELLRSLAGQQVPVVIYPNTDDFNGQPDPHHLGHLAEEWLALYPYIWAIGGCCGYFPEDVAGLKVALKS